MNAPAAIAAILAIVGLLLGASVLLTRMAGRVGVPIALGFIAVGMLAGSEGIGGIPFSDYEIAFRLGVLALVLIIFDGGLNTPPSTLRSVVGPSLVLASLGVVVTAAIVAVAARVAGLIWIDAWLLGAIVSSTDAAAVFSALRGTGLTLKTRVARTLEAESGLNDPVAVLLTVSLTTYALFRRTETGGAVWSLPATAAVEIGIGAVGGLVAGMVGQRLLSRIRLESAGLYPVLTGALALATFGLVSLAGGSGFLAVYVAAVTLAGSKLPYRASILRVHDAYAWLAQIGMFLMLGLLAFPSRLALAATPGFALAIVLTFLARPLAVALCVAPFGYSLRETLFLGTVGLRGAVPVVLATIPVIAGVPRARPIFDIVFFIVVVNTIIPGAVVAWLARRLGVVGTSVPEPQATIVIESSEPMRGALRSYFVDEALSVCGAKLADIPFPEGAAVTMILRGSALVVAEGSTELQTGDHVYVLANPSTEPMVQLLFGRPEILD